MTSPTYFDAYTHRRRLSVADTALILIDLQYASASPTHGLGKLLSSQGRADEAEWRFKRIEHFVVPQTRKLLSFFRSSNARIIHVTLGAELEDYSDVPLQLRETLRMTNNRVGTKEHEILKEVEPRSTELVVNKKTMGAFPSSGLQSALRSFGVQNIVCCGVSTNNCVDGTAREASDLGFGAVLCSDATGTCSAEMQEVTLKTFMRLYGRTMTADEIIAEMTVNVEMINNQLSPIALAQ